MKKILILMILILVLFGCEKKKELNLIYPTKITAAYNADITPENFSKKFDADFDWKSIKVLQRRDINWLRIEFDTFEVEGKYFLTPSSRSAYRVIFNDEIYHPFSGDFDKLYSQSYRSHPYILPIKKNTKVFYIYFEKSFIHFDFGLNNVVIGSKESIRTLALDLNRSNLIVQQISFYQAVNLLIIGLLGILLFVIIHRKQFSLLYFGLLLLIAGMFYFRMSALSVYLEDVLMKKSGTIFFVILIMNMLYLMFVNSFFCIKKKAVNITLFIIIVLSVLASLIFDRNFFFSRIIYAIFNFSVLYQIIGSLKRNRELNKATKYILATGFTIHTLLLTCDRMLGIFKFRIPLTPFSIGLNVIALAMVYYVIKNYKNKETELKQKKIELVALQKDNLLAELVSLKQQIDPHFLFNSLNTLLTLIDQSKDSAQDFVQELSKVYRFILKIKDKDLIEMEEELNFVKSYLFLLSHRFQKNLRVEFNLNEETKQKLIVPASLQMLVENCVKHNVVSINKPLTVKIYNDGDVLIVKNNRQPKIGETNSEGIGLENLCKRFSYFTEKKVEIIESNHEFIVKLPMIKEVD